MVVAAGTVDRQAEKHLPRGRHDVVEPVVAELLAVGRLVVPDAEPVVARRDEGVTRGLGQFVTGQLLDYELVIGLVVIERPDDVIAIPPGMRLVAVAFEGVCVGIANQIEPVSSPLLAVMLAGKEAVNHLLPGVGRVVGEEVADFLLGRRQACHVVGRPADQGRLIGWRRRREPAMGQTGPDEGVDRICERLPCLERIPFSGRGRHRGPHERPERPVFLPLSPLVDPACDRVDLRRRQPRPLGRHLRVGVVRGDPREDLALCSLARHDRPAATVEFGGGTGSLVES